MGDGVWSGGYFVVIIMVMVWGGGEKCEVLGDWKLLELCDFG